MTASVARVTSSAELQRRLCREVARVIGAPALRALHQRRAAPTVWTLLHVWAAIVATFALGGASLGRPPLVAALSLVALALFQGTRINALNVLVHEGSHHCLAVSRRANVLFANLAAGYPILFDAAGYRHVHAAHHRYLGEPGDPDRPLYAVRRGRAALLAGFAEDFLLLSLIRRALVYARGGAGASRARPLGARAAHASGKLAAQALLAGLLAAAFGPSAGLTLYAALWLVPLFTVYPAIIRLRVITEHLPPDRGEGAPTLLVARTSVVGPLEHYLLGAGMDFHFEHHLFPGIPYENLRRLHAALEERGFFSSGVVDRELALSGGYLAFWRRLLGGGVTAR